MSEQDRDVLVVHLNQTLQCLDTVLSIREKIERDSLPVGDLILPLWFEALATTRDLEGYWQEIADKATEEAKETVGLGQVRSEKEIRDRIEDLEEELKKNPPAPVKAFDYHTIAVLKWVLGEEVNE